MKKDEGDINNLNPESMYADKNVKIKRTIFQDVAEIEGTLWSCRLRDTVYKTGADNNTTNRWAGKHWAETKKGDREGVRLKKMAHWLGERRCIDSEKDSALEKDDALIQRKVAHWLWERWCIDSEKGDVLTHRKVTHWLWERWRIDSEKGDVLTQRNMTHWLRESWRFET